MVFHTACWFNGKSLKKMRVQQRSRSRVSSQAQRVSSVTGHLVNELAIDGLKKVYIIYLKNIYWCKENMRKHEQQLWFQGVYFSDHNVSTSAVFSPCFQFSSNLFGRRQH